MHFHIHKILKYFFSRSFLIHIRLSHLQLYNAQCVWQASTITWALHARIYSIIHRKDTQKMRQKKFEIKFKKQKKLIK